MMLDDPFVTWDDPFITWEPPASPLHGDSLCPSKRPYAGSLPPDPLALGNRFALLYAEVERTLARQSPIPLSSRVVVPPSGGVGNCCGNAYHASRGATPDTTQQCRETQRSTNAEVAK